MSPGGQLYLLSAVQCVVKIEVVVLVVLVLGLINYKVILCWPCGVVLCWAGWLVVL